MCQQKKLKMIALILAMNIMFIPILSAFQPKYNHSVVHAEETTINIAFFNAVLIMLGITSVMAGNMSSTFSIPETDLVALKDQFQATLDADATKKAAWMQAQTEYLAGGVAKTMGANELAKIGVYDIYIQFREFLKSHYFSVSDPINTENIIGFTGQYNMVKTVNRSIPPVYFQTAYKYSTGLPRDYSDYNVSYEDGRYEYVLVSADKSKVFNQSTRLMEVHFSKNDVIDYFAPSLIVSTNYGPELLGFSIIVNPTLYPAESALLLNYITSLGIVMTGNLADMPLIKGTIKDVNNIVNVDDKYIHVFSTIPWVDPAIPIGTVVNPANSAPYAGAVPIDIPITVPIDDPDIPIDPPVEEDNTTIGKILAALIPISGILSGIQTGVGSISDVMATGFDSVIDGIGDLAGTITGTTTGVLTNIDSMVEPVTASIENFFSPPSKDIDWDKLKNIQIFDKFPFSIPADLYFLMTMFASDPVAPKVDFNVDLSFIGASNTAYSYDLSQFDNFALILRDFELLAFVLFMLYATKNLIWK